MADFVLDFVGPGAILADKAAARAELNAAASQTALAATIVGRDQTFAARTQAQTAATAAANSASSIEGLDRFYSTRAAGEAATPVGEPFTTLESGNLVYYLRTSGGSTSFSPGAFATLAGTQTISGKTFAGATSFATNGDRLGITSDGSPILPSSLVQIVNKAISTGLRCSSYWEGSAAAPFQNHDNSLWETYNRVLDNSLNLSWSISAPNGYNDIPAGVRDDGERLGVYGWAVSVNIPGEYEHNGTLASQVGVCGRAGFRGDINLSPSTAVIENAVGVRGDVVGESPDATIENAYGGRFIVADSIASNVLNGIAVYAEAGKGSEARFSFFGAAGTLYNRDRAFFGESATNSGQSSTAISARGTPPNALEFGNGDSAGFGSNLGATAASGIPFLAFNAEAEASGNTFRTRGKKGAVIYSDLLGGLLFGRVNNASGSGQSITRVGQFTADGTFGLDGNFVIAGLQTFGTTRQTDALLAAREAGNNIEFGHPDTGLGSTIGATNSAGFSFLALNAEADPTGNTFRTRGRKGTVVHNDLNGALVFSRVTSASAAGQTLAESARFDDAGRLMLAQCPTYADNAAALAGGLAASHVYKTAAGELRIVV